MNSVLFQKDFEFINPVIHHTTKNQSFIRMAMLLKQLGIKNNTFHLVLYQPELMNVDPFDKNLTPEQKAMVIWECRQNFWYYLREIVRIAVPGSDPIPFELNRLNLALYWSILAGQFVAALTLRQIGKTTSTAVWVNYALHFLYENTTLGLITKDPVLIQDNVARIKEVRRNMPDYLLMKNKNDFDRREAISCIDRKNFYYTWSSPIDASNAAKTGRGFTLGSIHYDELPFINYNYIVYPSANAASLSSRQSLRKAGLVSPIIITTTAANPSTKTAQFALNIFENSCPFTESLYDLEDVRELENVMEKTGSQPYLYIEYSYKQLGKSEQWFKEACAVVGGRPDDIKRELLNIWTSGDESSILPASMIENMVASRRDPNFVDITDGFVVRWYIDKEIVQDPSFKNKCMIMGMDTSENVERDYTTFTILDPEDMSVMATCRCNDANTMQVARHVVKFLKSYPKLVWIPERKSTGTSIIDFAMEQLQNLNINPYFRIYNEVVQNLNDPKYKNVNVYDFRNIYGRDRSYFGYKTSGGFGETSRNMLYKTVMMKYLELNQTKLYDKHLINEYINLGVKNGRIDHKEGMHDDLVISSLLAAYLIFFGRNLNMYGLDIETFLTHTIGKDGNQVCNTYKKEQINIKNRIRELEEMVNRNPPYMIKQVYLRELAQLRPLVDDNVLTIAPIAVTQVERDEREVENIPRGATLGSLQTFTSMWKPI